VQGAGCGLREDGQWSVVGGGWSVVGDWWLRVAGSMVVSEGVEELGGREEVPGTRCGLRVAGCGLQGVASGRWWVVGNWWLRVAGSMVVNEGVEELGGDETIKDAGCSKK